MVGMGVDKVRRRCNVPVLLAYATKTVSAPVGGGVVGPEATHVVLQPSLLVLLVPGLPLLCYPRLRLSRINRRDQPLGSLMCPLGSARGWRKSTSVS